MIKTIFVPMSIKYTSNEYAIMQHDGSHARLMEQAKEARLRAEAELDKHLAEGYTILHAGSLETSRSVDFAFVLHKGE